MKFKNAITIKLFLTIGILVIIGYGLELYVHDKLEPSTTNYPPTIPAWQGTYIHPQAWPPKIEISSGQFSCKAGGREVLENGETKLQKINGQDYCITTQAEGAAGSIYTTYIYTTTKNNKLVTITFVLQAVQCLNYDDPQKTECLTERSTHDINLIINRIVEMLSVEK